MNVKELIERVRKGEDAGKVVQEVQPQKYLAQFTKAAIAEFKKMLKPALSKGTKEAFAGKNLYYISGTATDLGDIVFSWTASIDALYLDDGYTILANLDHPTKPFDFKRKVPMYGDTKVFFQSLAKQLNTYVK